MTEAKKFALAFRDAADGALRPQKAFREAMIEQASRPGGTNWYYSDDRQEGEFSRARAVSGVLNAIADVFEKLDTEAA